MILRQLRSGAAKVGNEYVRVVKPGGNIPCTAISEYDAEEKFDIELMNSGGCGADCPLCGNILKGLSNPVVCE